MQRSAQSWARTQLTHRHPLEYASLYKKEKGSSTSARARSRAQSKSKTALVKKYNEEYKELYKKALDSGYHNNHGVPFQQKEG